MTVGLLGSAFEMTGPGPVLDYEQSGITLKLHGVGKVISGTANGEKWFLKPDPIHRLMILGRGERKLMVAHRNILLNSN